MRILYLRSRLPMNCFGKGSGRYRTFFTNIKIGRYDMKNNVIDYDEMAYSARRALEREREELMGRAEQLDAYLRVLDEIDMVLKENSQLREDYDDLTQQLNDERQQRAELEMKLMEMGKLSTSMAQKASEENVLKALRTYVNRSKRKTADKRAFAKTATLEIANANGLDLPEDLKAAIESLDDEQTEPKVVTVQGNYNDVHDNGEVRCIS